MGVEMYEVSEVIEILKELLGQFYVAELAD